MCSCQKWKTYVLMNQHFIFEQVWGGGEWDNKKKIIEFASIFMLLRKESWWLIMKIVDHCLFFEEKKNPNKLCSDKIRWEIVGHVHN